MPHSAIATRTRKQAQTLRRGPTDAERKLWYAASGRSSHSGFISAGKRQSESSLLISRGMPASWLLNWTVRSMPKCGQPMTHTRTAWLKSQGYRVLRFWNNDVLKSPRSVGEAIMTAAQRGNIQEPHPQPLPHKGEGSPLRQAARDIFR